MKNIPKATVAAIITTSDNGVEKVLLTLRSIDPFKDQWCLPGGHIDTYESARDAIIREVREETGLNFNAEFFGSFDEIIPPHKIHAVVSVFKGQATGQLKAQSDEVMSIRWFSVDEALRLSLGFAHHDILEAYVCASPKPENNKPGPGILAEYASLRDELIKRIEMRQLMLTFALVFAGTLISLGVESKNGFLVLLFPVLAAGLALVWTQSDVRIGEIGEYIRLNIASRYQDLGEWEKFIRQKNRSTGFRPVEVATLGVFLGTELFSLALGISLYISGIFPVKLKLSTLLGLVAVMPLLYLDVTAIIFTFIIIQSRRRQLYKNN